MSLQKILFVDRDGTLIEEPEDFQIDAYEKLRFVEGVIPAMLKLRDAGYGVCVVAATRMGWVAPPIRKQISMAHMP